MSEIVPEGWSKVKISSLISEITERTNTSNQHEVLSVTKDGIKLQREYFKKQIASEDNTGYKIVRKGNLVFGTMNLWMGSLDVLKNPAIGIVSPAYKTFKFNPERCCVDFMSYFMRTPHMIHKYILHSQQGASIVRRNLDLDQLLVDEVQFPPLPEQKKIASILTSVDEVIETTQKQIDKLQDLKKANMNELLTKGIGHTEFKDSELGRIPKSWEVVRFDEISSQKTLGTAERGGLVDKIPLIKMGDLQLGNVIVGANETISKSKLTADNFLSKGDFLFNTRNTPELVGKVGNYNSSKLAAYDNNLLKIDFSEDISSLFMGMQFNEFNVKKRLRRIVAGTTSVAAIYWNDLKNFYVLKPSITEQKNIYAVFESIDNQVKTLECKLSQTQSLKKSLMQELLTGKVRVSVD